MGTIKKWLESSGMAAIVFMGGIGFILALVLSAFFTSGASSPVSEDVEGAYKTGSYTATADGFGGPVEVTVEIGSNGGITDVTIKGDKETPDIGGAAIPVLKQAILTNQTADVDGVSGATFTSDAVRTAAGAALAQAGGEEVAAGPKAADGNLFIPGTYTETGTGFGGEITVTTTVSENKIEDVQITGDHETENIGTFAVQMLGERILAAQSPNVDALTGATVTSNAILGAFKKTLTAAGADMSAFAPAEDKGKALKKYEDLTTDIVIIGAGGAGMTAAINATQAGKDVILVEMMPYAGGNTTKATGGMNAARDLVTIMAENSAAGIDWLDSIGAPLPKISFSGGATNQRIHAPEDGSGVGAYLVTALLKKMDELGIKVMYNTKATDLLSLEGTVNGILAESDDAYYTIHSKAVILATGGFGNNQEMIVRYREDLEGTVTTSAPGIMGDGIVMAQAVGADLVDIDQIQLHPTVEQKTSMLITESVRGDGAILVNQDGKRFTDELLTRDKVSAAELAQPGSYAYIIFDQKLREGLKATEKYISTGITVQGDTIEDLAAQIDVDPATLAETLANWNKCVADKNDAEFGRTTGMDNDLSTPPYYAIKIAPGIHHTMGGVHIDTGAHVIDLNGKVIPGLFAAGEVVGGVHGGNRLGGNAVADIVVFGRISSASAVEWCNELSGTEAAPETEAAEEADEETPVEEEAVPDAA